MSQISFHSWYVQLKEEAAKHNVSDHDVLANLDSWSVYWKFEVEPCTAFYDELPRLQESATEG